MVTEAPKPQSEQDKEARQFIETLEKTGQLVDVDEHQDTSRLPAKVTHVRYPDGTVKRIRFTGPGYQ
ncbi:allantoicase [Bradyrhizobium sp. AZCC 2262]